MKKTNFILCVILTVLILSSLLNGQDFLSFYTKYGTRIHIYVKPDNLNTTTFRSKYYKYDSCEKGFNRNALYDGAYYCWYWLKGFREVANPNDTRLICKLENAYDANHKVINDCLAQLDDNGKHLKFDFRISGGEDIYTAPPFIPNFQEYLSIYFPFYTDRLQLNIYAGPDDNIAFCSRHKSVPDCSKHRGIEFNSSAESIFPKDFYNDVYSNNQNGIVSIIYPMYYRLSNDESGWYFINYFQKDSAHQYSIEKFYANIYVKFKEYKNWYNNVREPKKEVMKDKHFYISKCVDSNHPEDYVKHECKDRSCIEGIINDKYFVDMTKKYKNNPNIWNAPNKWTYYTRKDDTAANPKKYYFCWYPAGKKATGDIVWDIWSADIYADGYSPSRYNGTSQNNLYNIEEKYRNAEAINDNIIVLNNLNGGMIDAFNTLRFIKNNYFNYSFKIKNNTESNILIYPFLSLSSPYYRKYKSYLVSFYGNKQYKQYGFKDADSYYKAVHYFNLTNSGHLYIQPNSQEEYHLIDFNIDKDNALFLKSNITSCLYFINADLLSLKGLINYFSRGSDNILAGDFYSYYCLNAFIDTSSDDILEREEHNFNTIPSSELEPSYLKYAVSHITLDDTHPIVELNENRKFDLKIKQSTNDNWLAGVIFAFMIDKYANNIFYYISKNNNGDYQLFRLSSLDKVPFLVFDKEQYLNYNNNILSFSVKDWCKYYGNTTIKLYEFYYYKKAFNFAELPQIPSDATIFSNKIKEIKLNCEN